MDWCVRCHDAWSKCNCGPEALVDCDGTDTGLPELPVSAVEDGPCIGCEIEKMYPPATPAEIAAACAPNPKTLMGRKRLPVSSVLPWPALMRIAEAMQYGAFEAPRADGGKGYGPFNWREQNIEAMGYVDANGRHCARWVEGQNVDLKSGVSELAHAAASLIILIDAIENGTVIDDRPKVRSQVATRILDGYEAKASK